MKKIFGLFAGLAQAGVINSLDRSVFVSASELTLTTCDIKFSPDAKEKQFIYTIPADFE
jgi:hypothetical protein